MRLCSMRRAQRRITESKFDSIMIGCKEQIRTVMSEGSFKHE